MGMLDETTEVRPETEVNGPTLGAICDGAGGRGTPSRPLATVMSHLRLDSGGLDPRYFVSRTVPVFRLAYLSFAPDTSR